MLDPRRNQRVERKKPFEEMLLKEIKGIFWAIFGIYEKIFEGRSTYK